MLAHIGMWGAVIAALGLIRFAIGGKGRWWQLILILLTLGGIAIGVLWVLGAGGLQPGRHADPAPSPQCPRHLRPAYQPAQNHRPRQGQQPCVSAARARAQASAGAAPDMPQV